MTKREPTGRVAATAAGRALLLERYFDADIDEVWASITESDRTARWFGRWTGTPGVGAEVMVTMGFEEGSPTMPMTITACEPPRRLCLQATDEYGEWNLEVLIDRDGERTRLTFLHHLGAGTDPGETGPGWEFYLDALVAAEAGRSLPDFDEGYFPGMVAYYRGE
ncbi:Activator of Hsp90 ATPase 1 family protein OS=Tsukamurella paurometabola (strain ATCC 8368 / DSM/ CCUG 35730 / CIP 100753 / JCM 10117 / KCTC 9821 / NBRC 16120 / NCIMB 702349 / NCTC 13040) OX=521096 GN=Tpau_1954 PE=3 SV=1 [Tsukamurella paurometabola]|uniref:Activator of Hsp90 ATPase 1 family protein n=1 Tax=Tsukamurella paurometabola (strain ATCC 8368 / DSM 20162 / CCUG 35730 / CIP 100753 / JCM 10117 / KCTC 9821 / NBRC 16120 / NCIMB 702349 / NCTC 13040) TaxID=521096 RepID=D5UNJ8_TSUPD|nr:SRPBCC family protein [Tsukamurella paurometabola]ADG78566.1 Activator of Hsp90 ATPase 1 family protein [Tsukamurella paurometabola DSM 20162]SUP32210.1 Activator of Hsp90 ATPase homolog 1-like protein [Tsukamurella paurometabola]